MSVGLALANDVTNTRALPFYKLQHRYYEVSCNGGDGGVVRVRVHDSTARYNPQIIRAPSPDALLNEGTTILKAYKERSNSTQGKKRRSSLMQRVTIALDGSSRSAGTDSAGSQGPSGTQLIDIIAVDIEKEIESGSLMEA